MRRPPRGERPSVSMNLMKYLTVADIDRHVGIDSRRYIRLLVRVGLPPNSSSGGGRQGGESRSAAAAGRVFKGSPIGIAYYLQKWFRFNLQDAETRYCAGCRVWAYLEKAHPLVARWLQNQPHLKAGLEIIRKSTTCDPPKALRSDFVSPNGRRERRHL